MHPRRDPHSRQPASGTAAPGFSLIELLIVVAIIGIISAIAYPSYGNYVTQTRRSDAHVALLSGVQAMERCKSTSYTYVGCSPPANSPEGHYGVVASGQSASAFTLTATAKTAGKQAGDTGCTALTIDATSSRGPTDTSGAVLCW